MRIRLFYIILFLSFLIIVGGLKLFESYQIDVSGKAVILGGSQNSIYENNKKIIPIEGAQILAARGKVLAQPSKVSIPLKEIKLPKSFALTNDQGIFKFKLLPGEYTFFIIIQDQAYLNSFDGKGNFFSNIIDSDIANIVITDDRGVLY